jgi:hypothetical protein
MFIFKVQRVIPLVFNLSNINQILVFIYTEDKRVARGLRSIILNIILNI